MEYTYTVIKSNRKTYTIRITDDNRMIIRAPKHATQRDIDKLIVDKKSWIDKILSFNRNNFLDTEDIRSFKSAYVFGKAMPVITDGKIGIDGNGVHISNMKNFQKAYVSSAGPYFLARFKEIEDKCNLHSKTVKFRSYKSRWGCCDSNKNIVFNFKVLMLPVALQNYVIVHELCHIKHLNHSAEFWALVKSFLPDYDNLCKQMKYYNFIVKMYC